MTASVGVKPSQQAPAPIARGAWWRSRLDGAATPTRLGLLLAVLVVFSLAWGVLAGLTASSARVGGRRRGRGERAAEPGRGADLHQPVRRRRHRGQRVPGRRPGARPGPAALPGGHHPGGDQDRGGQRAGRLVRRPDPAARSPGQAGRPRPTRPSGTTWPSCPGSCRPTPTRWARPGPTTGSACRWARPTCARPPTCCATTLLPAAGDIYTRESALLTSSSAQATGLPLVVVAVLVGLGIGYVLFRSSRWLARHTHRMVNYGLLLTALAGLVSLVWLAGAFTLGRADLLHAQQQGSVPAQAFARAEVAALAGPRGREPHPDRQQRRGLLPAGFRGPGEGSSGPGRARC